LTEQFVLQELQNVNNISTFYRSQDDSRAEIDFIIQSKGQVAPIEVKAEENLQSKSLKSFAKKYPEIKKSVRTSMADFRDEGWLINIPLYLISQIDTFLYYQ
jgi:predicted AAA+ superfamily ATPase